MLGIISPTFTLPQIYPSKPKSIPQFLPPQNPNLPSIYASHVKLRTSNLRNFRNYATDGNGNGSNDGADGKAENARPGFNLGGWVNLVVDSDPDNIVAVGLTGLLTWASVQVLWQLFLVSAAILLAALKYTIVAALLIFILITLL